MGSELRTTVRVRVRVRARVSVSVRVRVSKVRNPSTRPDPSIDSSPKPSA